MTAKKEGERMGLARLHKKLARFRTMQTISGH